MPPAPEHAERAASTMARLADIPPEELATILKRATLTARIRMREGRNADGMFWKGSAEALPASGEDERDFVHKALEQFMTGQRSWPEDVDLRKAIKEAVSSLVSNAVNKTENKCLRDSFDHDEELQDAIAKNDRGTDAHDVTLAKKEMSDLFKEGIEVDLEDDEDAYLVAIAIMEGASKPAQMASDTGFPVEEVYKILKRLRRRVEAFRVKFREEHSIEP